jgi:hypothetical protein
MNAKPGPELVQSYEDRYAALRASLKPGEEVGYVTDLRADTVEAYTELRLMQYAVAPAFITNNLTPKLIVGNFHTTGGMATATRENGLTLLKNFGQGVVLFRK